MFDTIDTQVVQMEPPAREILKDSIDTHMVPSNIGFEERLPRFSGEKGSLNLLSGGPCLTLPQLKFWTGNRRGENVYESCSDLFGYVESCLPTLSELARSKVSALTYDSVPKQTETNRQPFSSWKRASNRKLEETIALTRETVELTEKNTYLGNEQKFMPGKCTVQGQRNGMC